MLLLKASHLSSPEEAKCLLVNLVIVFSDVHISILMHACQVLCVHVYSVQCTCCQHVSLSVHCYCVQLHIDLSFANLQDDGEQGC